MSAAANGGRRDASRSHGERSTDRGAIEELRADPTGERERRTDVECHLHRGGAWH